MANERALDGQPADRLDPGDANGDRHGGQKQGRPITAALVDQDRDRQPERHGRQTAISKGQKASVCVVTGSVSILRG